MFDILRATLIFGAGPVVKALRSWATAELSLDSRQEQETSFLPNIQRDSIVGRVAQSV